MNPGSMGVGMGSWRSTSIPVLVLVLVLIGGALAVLASLSCSSERRPRVVVYAALDRVFAESILDEFERETGIEVRVQFDSEANKTTGLVERLRSERSSPRCDVFWNNEIVRTLRLAREGVLAPYESAAARDIPAPFKDAQHHWVGFAARARVVAFDPQKVARSDVPRTLEGLFDPRWKGQFTLANPQFGTTGTHLGFLFASRGKVEARALLQRLLQCDPEIVGSNGSSRDRVLTGQKLLGWTDTDDVEVVRRQGGSIDDVMVEEAGGVILIPNTLALIHGAPHPDNAKRLIDFLLREEIEARLAASPSRQIPLRDSVAVPPTGLRLSDLTLSRVSFEQAADALEDALRGARELLR